MKAYICYISNTKIAFCYMLDDCLYFGLPRKKKTHRTIKRLLKKMKKKITYSHLDIKFIN
ncbi:hypothetical protein [Longicatena caecimuris]|uniref:hypothetical protein n=1 Tax=Longicatena caecimuris TaxID=1796635 RepID=UPI000E770F74|nr:hypothetical protein DWX13_01125 [Eubacterium sp. AF18-3]